MSTIRNYGYIPPVIDEEEDYVLGGLRAAPYEIVLPSGDWRRFVPPGEPQKRGSLDTNSCTNFAWLNAIETFLDYVFKDTRNFSERFLAIVSGQTRKGNDPKTVAQAIHTFGLIEEFMLPFVDGMMWDEYFSPNPMTREHLAKAREFKNAKSFTYEYAFHWKMNLADQRVRLLESLKRSPTPIAVYAWEKRGEYYIRPTGAPDTHLTVATWVNPRTGAIKAYDSYPEDGQWEKTLSPDYDIKIAQGFHIGTAVKKSFWEWLRALFVGR